MQESNQPPKDQDTQANYNPTARNFDHTDVSGQPDRMSDQNSGSAGRNEAISEDSDPPLTEQDLEETGLSEEDADKIEWDSPEENERGQDRGSFPQQHGPDK